MSSKFRKESPFFILYIINLWDDGDGDGDDGYNYCALHSLGIPQANLKQDVSIVTSLDDISKRLRPIQWLLAMLVKLNFPVLQRQSSSLSTRCWRRLQGRAEVFTPCFEASQRDLNDQLQQGSS